MSSTFAKTYENYSSDWWTPPDWYLWAENTLGGPPVFDPCPSSWDPAQYPSGLDIQWTSPCYVNHPGSRGSTARWWSKYHEEVERLGQQLSIVWCAFSIEQLRHMYPTPFTLDGWLVLPRDRIGFIWGGPDKVVGTDKKTGESIIRKHGEPAKSPGNWTVFWTTERPAVPPSTCEMVRTGV